MVVGQLKSDYSPRYCFLFGSSSASLSNADLSPSNEAESAMIAAAGEEIAMQHGARSEPVVVKWAIGAPKAAKAPIMLRLISRSRNGGRQREEKPVCTVCDFELSPPPAAKGYYPATPAVQTVMRCVVGHRVRALGIL